MLDCITSELDTRFSAICNKVSMVLFLVPSIVVQDEFNSDVNNITGIYEDDLIDKYLVTRSWDFESANGPYVDQLIVWILGYCIGTNQLR